VRARLHTPGLLHGEPSFDAIHVGAAADELHAMLVGALAPGGRMVIPIGPRYSSQVRGPRECGSLARPASCVYAGRRQAAFHLLWLAD
jgi:protein-L-isoaspartate(D-aspartate) O-methyltransferase